MLVFFQDYANSRCINIHPLHYQILTICRIAPYKRRRTVRGSSATVSIASDNEHWNSMLLRPPLMGVMWNCSSRRPRHAPRKNSLHHRYALRRVRGSGCSSAGGEGGVGGAGGRARARGCCWWCSCCSCGCPRGPPSFASPSA